MVKKGLWVRLAAKPGKEGDVEKFLSGALPLAENDPATAAWFALKHSGSVAWGSILYRGHRWCCKSRFPGER